MNKREREREREIFVQKNQRSRKLNFVQNFPVLQKKKKMFVFIVKLEKS
jgi:hypothetical protein